MKEADIKSKPKLLKQYENDSDFIICVYEMPNNTFAVTSYDTIDRKHKKEKEFNTFEEALSFAKKINKEYFF